MKEVFAGKMIMSPMVLLVFVLVVLLGAGIMSVVVHRKWGYTPRREKELENKAEWRKK